MARRGTAWLGRAVRGMAMQGKAGTLFRVMVVVPRIMARLGQARHGTARRGEAGTLLSWWWYPRIMARQGRARRGEARLGKVKAGRFSVLPFFIGATYSKVR